METIDLKKIEQIETANVIKNLEWFYHGFDFCDTADILRKGILAKKHIPDISFVDKNLGWNGRHYVSVAKETNVEGRALSRYKYNGPLAILEGIKVIKCKESELYKAFRLTRLPLRYTKWSDEYQVYSKIPADKIIGLECMVYEWAKNDNIVLLRKVRMMLEMMQKLNIQLPVYDFSREEDGLIHELDKEAFLEVSEALKSTDLLSTLNTIR